MADVDEHQISHSGQGTSLPDDSSENDCGWLSWRPKRLNTCNTSRWLLLSLSSVGVFSGLSINGFTNSSITSIEKRFELSSSQTALIPVMYEISSSLLIIIIAYFFAHGNKPRWISCGGLIVGVGCLVFALPHFITSTYLYESAGSRGNMTWDLCPNEQDNVTSSCDNDPSSTEGSSTARGSSISSLSQYLYVFLLAQVLMGIGNAPTNALGSVYIDDNVSAKNIGMYLGIQAAVNNLAFAVGAIVGGIVLEFLYTDYNSVDADRLGLSPADNQWVGAWWLGFLFCAAGVFFWSGLLSLFPVQIPGTEEYRIEKEGQDQNVAGSDRASQPGFGVTFRDIPAATLVLFRNPIYVFLVLSNIADVTFLAGAEVFLAKFIEIQFALSAGDANISVGVIATVCGCGALLLGGWLIQRFNLQVPGMLKVCLGSNIMAGLLLFGIFFHCPDVPIAGVSVPYNADVMNGVDIVDVCNIDCNCSVSGYSPVCGEQGVTYFSACHAGCQFYDQEMNQYTNCSCISTVDSEEEQRDSNPLLPYGDGDGGSAVSGDCGESCTEFYVFAIFLSGLIFSYLLTGTPRANVALRCVPQRLRAFSSGLNSLIVRLLGSLPGAIIFGLLIDSSCLLWNEECGVRGRCYHYDRVKSSLYIVVYGIVMKLVAIACFIGALITYKPRHSAHEKNET